MKKRSFRSTFVSVILVITVAISIVNLAVYGINIKKIRQVEVLKMKTAGERIDDMITISLNNIKGLKQICCTDNYARNILLKNNEKNDIGTKFENQNYMDNALKHIASMDTLILRATIVNKYGNIYCTDTSIPEEYVKTIRNMTKEWMLFEGKEDEYYYGGLQGDNANILTFLYPLHTYGNTPIALLAVANVIENYNEMANKMNEYLVREIIYDKNQRKIQSKMLRYQINPHFLYNTLNLIASMGELSDFPEIVEITKNLSCIMQYNVKGSRFVSLKTEVEMVKAYLEIQRIRFHDCFSVEYEIERQIEQVRIVKFILQPIVENIFEHGFTMDENDNKIWIKAFKCENDIVILVKDNGCGIDSEKREELNRILCERTRRISYIDEEEKSIGINNVNTRIKNYYGEKYGVKVNKADKGTEIQLLLGIENLEEENKDK